MAKKSPAGLRSDGALVAVVYRRSDRAMRQCGKQQQRDDIGDLDHRIDRGASGVLVGIANRVAGHRGLVRLRALEMAHAVLVDQRHVAGSEDAAALELVNGRAGVTRGSQEPRQSTEGAR